MLRASVSDSKPNQRELADAIRLAVLIENLVDAFVSSNLSGLKQARKAVLSEYGWAYLVDICAVVGAFEMMTRLADATGAKLRQEQLEAAIPIRSELGLDKFASARLW